MKKTKQIVTLAGITLFSFSALLSCAENKELIASTLPATRSATDPAADKVLDALKQRGKDLKDFTADVSIAETDTTLGTEHLKVGKVWFQQLNNDETRIRVFFDKKKINGKMIEARHDYLLEGGTLIEMNFDKKELARRQVLKPGQKLNPLKLGEGPFPLPIGQEREEVYKNFGVKKMASEKDDPANTEHVRLKPLVGTRFARKFLQIDVFVAESGFPIRIVTLDKGGTTERTTDLTNLKINGGLKDDNFKMPTPNKDWKVVEEDLTQ